MPGTARAAWPLDPWSTPVTLRSLSSSVGGVRAVSDGAGGMIVVWQDARSLATTGQDVYAQRVDANGNVMWAAQGALVSNALGDQGTGLECVSDGAGGVIVVFRDDRNLATTGADIYAQRLSAGGARLWGASDLLVCNATGAQGSPVLVADGAGGAILAWHDSRSGTGDIYARRVTAAGSAQWSANGNPLCTAASEQWGPAITSNGIGGAIVAWNDFRNSATSGTDVYAQNALSGGGIGWTSNGVAVCGAANDQFAPVLVDDGALGATIVWRDERSGVGQTDLFADRRGSTGASLWGPDGIEVCVASGLQQLQSVFRDPNGAFLVLWADLRASNWDLYAQRIAPGGTCQWAQGGAPVLATSTIAEDAPIGCEDGAGGLFVAGAVLPTGAYYYDAQAQRVSAAGVRKWGSAGVPISQRVYHQLPAGIVSDGTGGAIVAYAEGAPGAYSAVLACRVDAFGLMLDARPFLTGTHDAANDQGGNVVVEWSASALDGDPVAPLSQYSVWRKVPIGSPAFAAARASLAGDDARALGADAKWRRTGTLALPQYWEYVGSTPAVGHPGYSLVVATTTDSTPSANPLTWFLVSAQRSDGSFWDSPADSGYSVDNLAPATPQPFSGQYAAGTTTLQWGQNLEADLAGYRLYRGKRPEFPTVATLRVAELTSVDYVDVAGQPFYYRVTAVDVHGNESPSALVMPAGTVGVPGDDPRGEPVLAAPSPNPLRPGAPLELHFTLPRAERATLALFDVQGREVVRLADGELEAGEHAASLAPRTAGAGALAAGLYFVRLEAGGERDVRRLVVLD